MKKLLLLLSLFSLFCFGYDFENCYVYHITWTDDLNDCQDKAQIEQWAARVMEQQEALQKQITAAQEYPAQLFDQQVRELYTYYMKLRDESIVYTIKEQGRCFSLKSNAPLLLQEYLLNPGFLHIEWSNGNHFMNIIHFEILQVSNELMKVQEYNLIMPRVNEFAKIAIEYNRIGQADIAMMLLDFCWAVLDAVTCMKMKIERKDNQDPIAKHLGRIIFGHYGIRVKPVKKTGNEIEQQRAKLTMMHDIITEKLHAIPTRDLVLTSYYASEQYLMSRVLQEVDLFWMMTMRSLGLQN